MAGAGITDQRLYNAYWRERFLGHPDQFPERYEALSLVRAAPKLTRPLLLIHGLADTNVYPAHTLRLSSALLAAGRPHEVLLLPSAATRPRARRSPRNCYGIRCASCSGTWAWIASPSRPASAASRRGRR